MKYIREYVMMLLIAAVICAVVTLIIPERKPVNGINKYIRWISSIVLLTVMVSPVKDAIATLTAFSVSNYSNGYNSAWIETENELLIKTTIELLENNVKSVLVSRFGITDAEVKISANDTDPQNIQLTNVTVTLNNTYDSRKSTDVGRYIATLLECDTKINDGDRSEQYRFVC